MTRRGSLPRADNLDFLKFPSNLLNFEKTYAASKLTEYSNLDVPVSLSLAKISSSRFGCFFAGLTPLVYFCFDVCVGLNYLSFPSRGVYENCYSLSLYCVYVECKT